MSNFPSSVAALLNALSGREYSEGKVALDKSPALSRDRNKSCSVRLETEQQAFEEDSKYAARVLASTEVAIKDGCICYYCRNSFCWGACRNGNSFDHVCRTLHALWTAFPQGSYWRQTEFCAILAFWAVRMFNAFASDRKFMEVMRKIATYLRNNIEIIAHDQAGYLRSDLGVENDKSLGFSYELAKMLGSVERDFHWIAFREQFADHEPQRTNLDKRPRPTELARRLEEIGIMAVESISAESPPSSRTRKSTAKKIEYDEQQEELRQSKSPTASKTKKQTAGNSVVSPSKPADKKTVSKSSKATKSTQVPKNQMHIDNGSVLKSTPESVLNVVPISKTKRVLDIAREDGENVSSEGHPKKRRKVSEKSMSASKTKNTRDNEQGPQSAPLAFEDSPPWVYKHEAGHLGDLGLAVGEYDVIGGKANITIMGETIIERVPGQRMKSRAVAGMINEWTQGKMGTDGSVKSTLSRSELVESRSKSKGDLSPWWCLKSRPKEDAF